MATLNTMLAQPFQFVFACPRPEQVRRIAAVVRWFSLWQGDAFATRHTAEHEDIRQSQNGDDDAYRRLIQRHQATVGNLLWRFTRDRTEHEELVQQTFVEAWMGLSGFRAEAPFAHWLARIATRVGYRFWNRTRRNKQVALPDEAWQSLAQPDSGAIEAHQAADLVHRLLAQLPPRDRLVLTMRYLEQCDIAQTAYRLGWTQTRVKVQTHRAIAKLKKRAADIQIELEL